MTTLAAVARHREQSLYLLTDQRQISSVSAVITVVAGNPRLAGRFRSLAGGNSSPGSPLISMLAEAFGALMINSVTKKVNIFSGVFKILRDGQCFTINGQIAGALEECIGEGVRSIVNDLDLIVVKIVGSR